MTSADEYGTGWNINGTWKIQCPELERHYGHLTDRHGRPKPYTMKIFTTYSPTRNGTSMEIYGRFAWGIHKGVFRFCNSGTPLHGYYPNAKRQAGGLEYSLVGEDEPSYEDLTWCYRWRGRMRDEDEDEG